MSEDQNKKVNEIVISLYFDICLTHARAHTYLMKIIFKESMYKILNIDFYHYSYTFYILYIFFARKWRFSSYFIYSYKSDLQIAGYETRC